jgi:hypothetical protein
MMNLLKVLAPEANVLCGYLFGAVAFTVLILKNPSNTTQAAAVAGGVAIGVSHLWDTVAKASNSTTKGN